MLRVNVLSKVDVLVCGGGPAGIGAAIAAARAGLNTMLLELNGSLGGTAISSALPMCLGYTNGSIPFPQMVERKLQYKSLPHPRKAVGGIFEMVMDAITTEGGSLGPIRIPQTDKYPGLDRLGCHDDFIFDMETGKRVLDSLMMKHRVQLRYYARVIDVRRKGDAIEGIYFADPGGISYCPADCVVDCTGDAVVTYNAGFETIKGDKEDGAMAIAGLVAHLENINSAEIERYLNAGNDPWFRPLCAKAREEHPDLDLPARIIMFPMMQEGVYMINGGLSWGGYDGTDGEDMTRLTIRGRKEADVLTKVLFRNYIPGAKNARIRLTANYPGIRETRKIVSERGLTEADLLSGTVFRDTIALGGRHFDLQKQVEEQHIASKGLKAALGVSPIPYSAMIPKGSVNLIAAGRCIDAQGQSLGPARVMSTCMAMGEAAGTAAILKQKSGIPFRDVDIQRLRDMLRNQGAIVDPVKNEKEERK